jgi:hypothetical protein
MWRSAVTSVKDEYSGERPKTFVVLKQGPHPEEKISQRLMVYVREKKVRYKALCEVEFVDAIPKSAGGKISRRILRDEKRMGTHGMVVREKREQAQPEMAPSSSFAILLKGTLVSTSASPLNVGIQVSNPWFIAVFGLPEATTKSLDVYECFAVYVFPILS